jgi:hypothetical protein
MIELATTPGPAHTSLIPAVMGSERLPMPICQALNVESSLNDGITTRFAAEWAYQAEQLGERISARETRFRRR